MNSTPSTKSAGYARSANAAIDAGHLEVSCEDRELPLPMPLRSHEALKRYIAENPAVCHTQSKKSEYRVWTRP